MFFKLTKDFMSETYINTKHSERKTKHKKKSEKKEFGRLEKP